MSRATSCTFRITGAYPDGFVRDMRTRYSMTLMIREYGENGDNLHYHGYCAEVKLETLRTYLKRHFKGNDQYSCKKAGDDDAALRYLCKGKALGESPEVVYNEGHVVQTIHESYWEHNKVYKKRARKGDILETCYADIEPLIGVSTDRTIIGSEILGWYDEMGKRMPARFAMDTMITTYIVRQNKKQAVPLTKVEMFNQLYGN